MESSSSFVQHQPFRLTWLLSEFQLDKLPQNDGEEGAGTEGRRQNCGKIKTYSYELVFNCSGKFLIRARSDCIQRPGETHSFRGKPESRVRRNSKPDAASSSQVKLQDAWAGWGNLSQQMRIRYCGNFLKLNPRAIMKMKQRRSLPLIKRPQGNLKHPAIQKTLGILKDVVKSMRRIYDLSRIISGSL